MNWVLKLGGSLYTHSSLVKMLKHAQHLSRPSAKCTIVPGGGPFADQVRAAYRHWHLDEATAHRMAILGMCQYGRLLANISQIPICYSESRSDEKCVIWLPTDNPQPACLAEIPSHQLNWDFTSDSISLCLAHHIDAQYLILLKAIPSDKKNGFEKLVDKHFMALMQDSPVKIVCVSAEQWLEVSNMEECISRFML